MPFVVKATYRNETRKFSFKDSSFPSYEDLYHQLYRIFAVGHSYYLSKLLFSPQEGARILIGMEAHSAAEYDVHCAPFKGRTYPNGCLAFSVFDETPHKVPMSRPTVPNSFIHPIPPVPPIPFFAPPPPPPPPPPPAQPQPQSFSPPTDSPNTSCPPRRKTFRPIWHERGRPASPARFPSWTPPESWAMSPQYPQQVDLTSLPPAWGPPPGPPPALYNVSDRIDESFSSNKQDTATATNAECCHVAQGKKEVKLMMDGFLRDFTRIMGSTFGEDHSFLDPLSTPTIERDATPRASTPVPVMDLEASLPIPGSFIQPRPHSPEALDDSADVEKSQTPPQLEPLQTLHPGIWCDFCGKQIRGLRFKCQECTHYDLCANCIVVNQALEKHNSGQTLIHAFNTVNPPTPKESSLRERILALDEQIQATCLNTSNTPGPIVHSCVTCDICERTVVGNRHKCLDCPDYDLCDNCIGDAPSLHPTHQFLKLDIPGRVIVHNVNAPPDRQSSPAAHNARCNLCDSRIIGDRYKCTDCPDFDTCASCFAITPEQHPHHSFVKVSRPADLMVRRNTGPVYHFATCDGCNKNIVGVRYKCMHPDCPDFDLCQDCEALPIGVHPATHPFLKIRSGDTRIPSVPRNISRGLPLPPVQEVFDSPARAATPVPGSVINSAPVPDVTSALGPDLTSIPVAIPPPVPASDSTTVPDTEPAHAILSSPPVSTHVERLHAIRMQAERRLSARMQQLQSYPFVASTANPAVDPIIEERLLREHKEAEEKARMMDKEIEELEKARRRRHEDNLKQSARPYLESLKAAFADTPEVYQSILKLLIDHFGTRDAALSASLNQQIRALLAGQPTLLEGLDAFLSEEGTTSEPEPAEPVPEPQLQHPPLEEFMAPAMAEIIQRTISRFGNAFRSPLETLRPLQATFLSDNNIPDGHIFPAGAEFVKSWRLQNHGTEAWSEGTELVFVGGMRLGAFEDAPTSYDVGSVNVGEEVDVCAGDMKAPEVPGRYISHWRLRDPEGRQFGPRMWCDIEVLEVESDNSHHGSLVNSAVVMPETAPQQAASVIGTANPLSSPSSPITVPSSVVTMTDDASSDASSVGSVSIIDQSDSDWDEIPDVLSRQQSATVSRGNVGEEIEYQVLYDSASDEA